MIIMINNEKKIIKMIENKISIEMKRRDSDIEKIYIFNNFENRKIINIELSDFELEIEMRISPDFLDFKIYDDKDILERIFLDLYSDDDLKERIKDFLFRMIELNDKFYHEN